MVHARSDRQHVPHDALEHRLRILALLRRWFAQQRLERRARCAAPWRLVAQARDACDDDFRRATGELLHGLGGHAEIRGFVVDFLFMNWRRG